MIDKQLPEAAVMLEANNQYAVDFVQALFSRGIRSVLIYPSAAHYYGAVRTYPGLITDAVASVHTYDGTDLARLAGGLRSRYRVVAVIPHSEPVVESSADLAELLDVTWCDPVVLRRFRNKAAMKRHLQSVSDIPVTDSVPVTSAGDVRRFAGALSDPGDFVLKPVDGMGNMDIRFFHRDSTDQAVQEYLAGAGGRAIAEATLVGDEYQVNGQVDGQGGVEIFAVLRALRTPNRRGSSLALLVYGVSSRSSEFTTMSEYARAIVAASGLRRSPFHLEAMLTPSGPRLIEIAARIAGTGAAYHMDASHSGRLKSIDLATHYFLNEHKVALALDWDRYDVDRAMLVFGTSDTAGIVSHVSGIKAVEGLPEFIGWGVRPVAGSRVARTEDLVTKAYAAILRWGDDETAAANEAYVRGALRWRVGPFGQVPALVRRSRGAILTAVAFRHRPEPL